MRERARPICSFTGGFIRRHMPRGLGGKLLPGI